MKGKTILILGAGNVGEACAALLAKIKPSKIILHTLTEKEAVQAKENVYKLGKNKEVLIETSFGNVLFTQENSGKISPEISDNVKKDLLEYIYFPFSEKIAGKSSLFNLLIKYKPDYIIDSINIATVVGCASDPYFLAQYFLKKEPAGNDLFENMLLSATIPILTRFVQVLHKYLAANNHVVYVKVSTTGSGGMGMNIKYTHGDLKEAGMSNAILGKVAAAGVFNQLLWTLANTPGINVRVVIPATLIGWQEVGFGKFISNGRYCMRNKKIQKINISELPTVFNNSRDYNDKTDDYLEIPFVESGENEAYSLAEMTAITAQGQMEAITREEVAKAVLDCMHGTSKYDMISAMDLASLKSTYTGAVQRNNILDKVKCIQDEKCIPSIATNNLGPTVTKHLYELYFILEAGNFNLKNIVSFSTADILVKIKEIVSQKTEIINQILSLGLPVLQEDNMLIIGDRITYPKNQTFEFIDEDKINYWAKLGWVDLREKQIQTWVDLILKMYNELNNPDGKMVDIERNLQSMNKTEVLGEVLAYLYSISGGNRRKN
jgi:hypothetical protein